MPDIKNYIVSKLQHAMPVGLTLGQIQWEDAHLSSYTADQLQRVLSELELERRVVCEVILGRGEVYRLYFTNESR